MGTILPITINIETTFNMNDNEQFRNLTKMYSDQADQIWICKPGENANRGYGIEVLPNLAAVKKFLQSTGAGERWVVQKYIDRPLLVGGQHWLNTPMRKFDIRIFGLAQIIDGVHFRGYFYNEGYIRTSSYKYSINNLADRDTHLTNDAVQQVKVEYGKYEPGNKISFKDFAVYLKNYKDVDFESVILPKMKEAIKETLIAFWYRLQSLTDKPQSLKPILNQFELFGYDFMIDEDMRVYLIEVNTNPCLDTSPCPLLHRLITQILDQTFKITVDPFLRGRDGAYGQAQEMAISEINYEMVYSNSDDLLKGICQIPSQSFEHHTFGTQNITAKQNKGVLRRENSAEVIMDPDEPEYTPLDDDGLDYLHNDETYYSNLYK